MSNISLIFKAERYSGYSTLPYSSDIEDEIVKQVSESELNSLIPDSFEETDWKKVRMCYKLDDSENIVFDEGYEPDEEGV